MVSVTRLRLLPLVCVLAWACLTIPTLAQEKAPAPDKEAQAKAEKLIKDLFKVE